MQSYLYQPTMIRKGDISSVSYDLWVARVETMVSVHEKCSCPKDNQINKCYAGYFKIKLIRLHILVDLTIKTKH